MDSPESDIDPRLWRPLLRSTLEADQPDPTTLGPTLPSLPLQYLCPGLLVDGVVDRHDGAHIGRVRGVRAVRVETGLMLA